MSGIDVLASVILTAVAVLMNVSQTRLVEKQKLEAVMVEPRISHHIRIQPHLHHAKHMSASTTGHAATKILDAGLMGVVLFRGIVIQIVKIRLSHTLFLTIHVTLYLVPASAKSQGLM